LTTSQFRARQPCTGAAGKWSSVWKRFRRGALKGVFERRHMEISEYRLLRQSALMRLFSVAALTGIADMITGNDLLMRRFVADFTRTYGRVDVPLARTYGSSLPHGQGLLRRERRQH
jgi:hypothetical protein